MAEFSDLYLNYQTRRSGHPLLWPVWVWSLHVPTRRHKGLNALAHAVLALHEAGQDDPHWIAPRLGIDSDLVRYIVVAQLVPNGWLDRYQRITEEGRRQLHGDPGRSLDQRAGLLFQSAETGDVWPRFRGDLREIEPLDHNARYPRFLQDRDSGRTLTPFLLRPNGVNPPAQPGISQILEALRLDRIARHHRRQRDGEPLDTEDVLANSIDFIDPLPRSAWLLCRVYDKAHSDHPWLVSDPLGQSTAAAWMRREVYQASRRVPELASALSKFLGEIDESLDWEAYRRREDELVRLEVLTDFPGVGRIPDLEEALIPLLRSRATVVGAGKNARPEEAGTLTIEAQKVLEHCCLWCLLCWPLANPRVRLRKQMKPDELVKAMGMAAPEISPQLIDKLQVQPGKVFWAVTKGQASLRSYLAGLLLSLADHPDHPFRPLVSDEDLMRRILQLSHDRDVQGHGGDPSGRRAGSETAIQHADTALDAVHRLTEGT